LTTRHFTSGHSLTSTHFSASAQPIAPQAKTRRHITTRHAIPVHDTTRRHSRPVQHITRLGTTTVHDKPRQTSAALQFSARRATSRSHVITRQTISGQTSASQQPEPTQSTTHQTSASLQANPTRHIPWHHVIPDQVSTLHFSTARHATTDQCNARLGNTSHLGVIPSQPNPSHYAPRSHFLCGNTPKYAPGDIT
jgi:hypothetical protein